MDDAGPDLAIAIYCVITGVLGIIVNCILLLLIMTNKDLRRKEYIYFILNRTLADFIYSITQITIQPVAILLSGPSSTMCAAAGFLELALAVSSIYSEPMLACNRYVSIFRSDIYKKVYSRRNVCLICIAVWLLGTLTNVPHIVVGSLGRSTGSICTVRFASDTMPVVSFNFTMQLVGIVAVLFCNFKMFFFLNKHQKQPMTNSQRTKLQSDQEMLRFIFVAAFLPICFQFPGIVMLCVKMFVPVSDWLVFSSIAIFVISFVLNPVITLLMVRPIRKQLVTKIKRFMGRHASTVEVEPIGQITHRMGQSKNALINVEGP